VEAEVDHLTYFTFPTKSIKGGDPITLMLCTDDDPESWVGLSFSTAADINQELADTLKQQVIGTEGESRIMSTTHGFTKFPPHLNHIPRTMSGYRRSCLQYPWPSAVQIQTLTGVSPRRHQALTKDRDSPPHAQ
jgi:hypothetical protein